MKRKIAFLLLRLGVLIAIFPTFGLAQISDSVSSEWVQVKRTDVPADLLTYLETNGYVKYQNPYLQPERISNFMKNVVYFGSVTDITLSKITDNTNKFADTKLGTLAMLIIAYNVAGEEFIKFLTRFTILVIFIILYTSWWRKRMLPRSIADTTDESGTTHYKMQVPLLWVEGLWLVLFIVMAFIII